MAILTDEISQVGNDYATSCRYSRAYLYPLRNTTEVTVKAVMMTKNMSLTQRPAPLSATLPFLPEKQDVTMQASKTIV